jgi:hypothetical protein
MKRRLALLLLFPRIGSLRAADFQPLEICILHFPAGEIRCRDLNAI